MIITTHTLLIALKGQSVIKLYVLMVQRVHLYYQAKCLKEIEAFPKNSKIMLKHLWGLFDPCYMYIVHVYDLIFFNVNSQSVVLFI